MDRAVFGLWALSMYTSKKVCVRVKRSFLSVCPTDCEYIQFLSLWVSWQSASAGSQVFGFMLGADRGRNLQLGFRDYQSVGELLSARKL